MVLKRVSKRFTAARNALLVLFKLRVEPTAERSPFLALPLEIRRKIYKLVLKYDVTTSRLDGDGPTVVRGEPAVLRVCRQIHFEANEIWYKENSFIQVSMKLPLHDCLSYSHDMIDRLVPIAEAKRGSRVGRSIGDYPYAVLKIGVGLVRRSSNEPGMNMMFLAEVHLELLCRLLMVCDWAGRYVSHNLDKASTIDMRIVQIGDEKYQKRLETKLVNPMMKHLWGFEECTLRGFLSDDLEHRLDRTVTNPRWTHWSSAVDQFVNTVQVAEYYFQRDEWEKCIRETDEASALWAMMMVVEVEDELGPQAAAQQSKAELNSLMQMLRILDMAACAFLTVKHAANGTKVLSDIGYRAQECIDCVRDLNRRRWIGVEKALVTRLVVISQHMLLDSMAQVS